MFSQMMRDRITVVKPDGTRFSNLKAVVSAESIIFFDVKVPLEEGDVIERQLPAGRAEVFDVLDTGFNRGSSGIPDFYNARVRKTTSKVPVRGSASVTNVTMTGPNSRINVGSVDNSTNIAATSISPELFDELRSALRNGKIPKEDLTAIEAKLDSVQRTVGTLEYNRAYADFVQHAANWMTILGPFLPALTKALSS